MDLTLHDDYLEKVPTPMDLSTIKEQLASDNYDNPNDLNKDLQLIFQNSKIYDHHSILKMAERLQKLAAKQMKKIMHNYEKDRRSIEKLFSSSSEEQDSSSGEEKGKSSSEVSWLSEESNKPSEGQDSSTSDDEYQPEHRRESSVGRVKFCNIKDRLRSAKGTMEHWPRNEDPEPEDEEEERAKEDPIEIDLISDEE